VTSPAAVLDAHNLDRTTSSIKKSGYSEGYVRYY